MKHTTSTPRALGTADSLVQVSAEMLNPPARAKVAPYSASHRAARPILKPLLKANIRALARLADVKCSYGSSDHPRGYSEPVSKAAGRRTAPRQRATATKAGSRASVQPSSTHSSLSFPGGEQGQNDRAGSWVAVRTSCGESWRGGSAPSSAQGSTCLAQRGPRTHARATP